VSLKAQWPSGSSPLLRLDTPRHEAQFGADPANLSCLHLTVAQHSDQTLNGYWRPSVVHSDDVDSY